MDLFAGKRRDNIDSAAPLAVRMRPRTLDEFTGQQHFIGEGKLLRRMLLADRLTSVIFYGPPGTGKTTLAGIIANVTHAAFEHINATGAGVKELRDILGRARDRLGEYRQRTVLFVDEIHRFNRSQQDVLLKDVEEGVVIMIGATTENPYFSVNSPLVSRSQVFQFEALSEDDIISVLRRALADEQRGLGGYDVQITDEALQHLAVTSDGDARRALSALEIGVLSLDAQRPEPTEPNDDGDDSPMMFDLQVAVESIQQKALEYDGTGDTHYDTVSAFIKSMRGSDPDATVYWLARMMEAGEEVRFIARRIAICASEDVGNADPMALVLANAAVQASDFVGWPEAQLILAQAAIYIACAPKSNASAMAIWTAAGDVRNARTLPVPKYLRDAHYSSAKKLGHGEGYQYSHKYKDGIAPQQYLGVDKQYYNPTDRGHERRFREYLDKVRAVREQSQQSQPDEDRTDTDYDNQQP